jgi:hypothetical protein
MMLSGMIWDRENRNLNFQEKPVRQKTTLIFAFWQPFWGPDWVNYMLKTASV